MWPMIAEPGLRCSQCRHEIQPGRLCLSELPEEKPSGVNRSDFRNYCIGCPTCWEQGKSACYLRYLEDTRPKLRRVPHSLPCSRCRARIESGDLAIEEVHYDWQQSLSVSGAAVGTDLLIRGVPSGSFVDLSESLRSKLSAAGGVDRNLLNAESFFQDSIPFPVRNLGENAVNEFVHGKDASHILSQSNHPRLASRNDNIIWEDSYTNRARGAEDMGFSEQLMAQSTNAFDAVEIVFRECLQGAGMAAFYAMFMEAPITTIENYIYYRKGIKTGLQASSDAIESLLRTAVVGAAVGFAVTVAIAAGAGPLIVTIAPVLSSVGFALYGVGALSRIQRAYRTGPLLDRVGILFCSPRCHVKFADEMSRSALIRWERNRRPPVVVNDGS